LAPNLKDVKEHLGDGMKIIKIDVAQKLTLASHYNVNGVPRLYRFKITL
jgi:thioredoxin 1